MQSAANAQAKEQQQQQYRHQPQPPQQGQTLPHSSEDGEGSSNSLRHQNYVNDDYGQSISMEEAATHSDTTMMKSNAQAMKEMKERKKSLMTRLIPGRGAGGGLGKLTLISKNHMYQSFNFQKTNEQVLHDPKKLEYQIPFQFPEIESVVDLETSKNKPAKNLPILISLSFSIPSYFNRDTVLVGPIKRQL